MFKLFVLPSDVIELLADQVDETQFVGDAIRQKARRDLEINLSLESLSFEGGDNDVSWMRESQARVALSNEW